MFDHLSDELLDLPALDYMGLWNNRFNFDVLQALQTKKAENPDFDFEFDSQQELSLTNRNPELSTYAGNDLSKYTYHWYKDGVNFATVSSDSIITITTPGEYYVRVTTTDDEDAFLTTSSVLITDVYSLEKRDSLALVALYNSTNGPEWSNNTNWLSTEVPIDDWHGVTVEFGRVYVINLPGNKP